MMTIIVNGREKQWMETEIDYRQIVTLAYGSYNKDMSTSYTVTYKGGPDRKREGVMVDGDLIHVANKMIFNVSATNKS